MTNNWYLSATVKWCEATSGFDQLLAELNPLLPQLPDGLEKAPLQTMHCTVIPIGKFDFGSCEFHGEDVERRLWEYSQQIYCSVDPITQYLPFEMTPVEWRDYGSSLSVQFESIDGSLNLFREWLREQIPTPFPGGKCFRLNSLLQQTDKGVGNHAYGHYARREGVSPQLLERSTIPNAAPLIFNEVQLLLSDQFLCNKLAHQAPTTISSPVPRM